MNNTIKLQKMLEKRMQHCVNQLISENMVIDTTEGNCSINKIPLWYVNESKTNHFSNSAFHAMYTAYCKLHVGVDINLFYPLELIQLIKACDDTEIRDLLVNIFTFKMIENDPKDNKARPIENWAEKFLNGNTLEDIF